MSSARDPNICSKHLPDPKEPATSRLRRNSLGDFRDILKFWSYDLCLQDGPRKNSCK